MGHDITAYRSWEQEARNLVAECVPDREDWPHIWYDEESDRLTVMLRHNNDQNVTTQNILPGVDVLLLTQPKPEEERFTGIVLSQGVRKLVERIYQENSGEDYLSYQIRHNEKQILTTVARIFRAVIDRHDPTELPIPFLDRINQMFVEEPHLAVHIPL